VSEDKVLDEDNSTFLKIEMEGSGYHSGSSSSAASCEAERLDKGQNYPPGSPHIGALNLSPANFVKRSGRLIAGVGFLV
jgi:hypothetical protein